jgi:hypothetical protein
MIKVLILAYFITQNDILCLFWWTGKRLVANGSSDTHVNQNDRLYNYYNTKV